jgi:hypothetical protein
MVFPCVVLEMPNLSEVSGSSTCLAVVGGNGPNLDAQRFQALRSWRDRMGQRRHGGEHTFTLDMDEHCPVVPSLTSVIVFAAPPQRTPEVVALGGRPVQPPTVRADSATQLSPSLAERNRALASGYGS